MNKYWKGLIALLVLSLLLTGCGAGGSKDETTPTEPTKPGLAEHLSGNLSMGDQIPKMTFSTSDGQLLTMSQLLEEKKAVVLNFWFADCMWCVKEFPVMEVAYQRFREDVEIVALNPYDSNEVIAAFKQEHSLSFPMANHSIDLANAFGVRGYPTTVVIDREGKICLIHAGAITDVKVFDKLFAALTAENYTSRVFGNISEFTEAE